LFCYLLCYLCCFPSFFFFSSISPPTNEAARMTRASPATPPAGRSSPGDQTRGSEGLSSLSSRFMQLASLTPPPSPPTTVHYKAAGSGRVEQGRQGDESHASGPFGDAPCCPASNSSPSTSVASSPPRSLRRRRSSEGPTASALGSSSSEEGDTDNESHPLSISKSEPDWSNLVKDPSWLQGDGGSEED
jgi:hypothetical protein